MTQSVDGRTRVVGIIGWPVEHSLSPRMHNAEFDRLGLNWIYTPWAVSPDDLPQAVAGLVALRVAGFNVTVPHKETVTALMDTLTDEARMIGAVNTVRIDNGLLTGTNTDAAGWSADIAQGMNAHTGTTQDMKDAPHPLAGKAVFVIGAGGAARAVVAGACLAGTARVVVAARRFEQAGALVGDMHEHLIAAHLLPARLDESATQTVMAGCDVVVNTTPVGMASHPGSPVPEEWLLPHHFVYDTIYAPAETPLLVAAAARGAQTRNGLGMLARQGAAAFEFWTGKKPDADRMEQLLLARQSAPTPTKE